MVSILLLLVGICNWGVNKSIPNHFTKWCLADWTMELFDLVWDRTWSCQSFRHFSFGQTRSASVCPISSCLFLFPGKVFLIQFWQCFRSNLADNFNFELCVKFCICFWQINCNCWILSWILTAYLLFLVACLFVSFCKHPYRNNKECPFISIAVYLLF